MNYKIINNLSSPSNHFTLLKELFENSDNVLIASPFLMTDFADFFTEIDISNLHRLSLITTLSPKSLDQVKKINTLISLIEIPDIKNGKIDCQISLNNKLHGKIYIFKNSNIYCSAVISSANFTDYGLSRNHEWGVQISDKEEIGILEQSILETIEFSNLSFDEIYRMQEATSNFLAKQPPTERIEIDLKLIDYLSSTIWATEPNDSIEFWLKPIGVTEYPVTEDRLFNDMAYKAHFSKSKPQGVKPNDILIAYGVGTTKILSIYRVTSYPKMVTKEEIEKEEWFKRWPWYVETSNLTPNYGATWPKHNLFINALKDQYLGLHSDDSITSVGGQTLGALNYGKDKLRLSPNFAKYIIDKVIAINNRR